jgi:hypothetical protein
MLKINVLFLVILINFRLLFSFDILFEHKLKISDKHKAGKDAIHLNFDNSFKLDMTSIDSILKMPVCLKIKEGKIFILDNNRHRLIVYSKDGKFLHFLGQQGRGPGDIFYPQWFDFLNDNICIANGNGLDIFGKDLKFINRIRVFIPMSRFSILKDNIYCSVNSYRKENPLFMKLDMNGIVKDIVYDKIDKDLNKSHITKTSQEGFILFAGNRVIYVTRHWNKVYIFNHSLKLIKKLRIKYRLLDEIENWNRIYLDKMTPRITWFSKMVASAKFCNNKIYLLINIPRFEIISIDLNGNIQDHFYNDMDFKYMIWKDFEILFEQGKTSFWVAGNSIGEEIDKRRNEYAVYRFFHGAGK